MKCTRSRDRTGTVLLPLVFETNASTNSAIRALHKELWECEYRYLFLSDKIFFSLPLLTLPLYSY